MKCFYHSDRDAVGTCKSCGKGLCPDCAVDLTKGLACRDKCEKEVANIIALIDQNIQFSPASGNIMGNMRRNTFAQASFLLTAGAVFFLTGWATDHILDIPGLLGIVFIVYGCYVLRRGLKLPKQ